MSICRTSQSVPTIVTVVGARPQFVKAAPVSRALAQRGVREVLVHTGQHYDAAMSDVFFERLGIPAPAHHLGVGSGSHGAQTGRMLEKIEAVLLAEKPAAMLVYGDTNSTLAAALAAVKLHLPVAHVEAGLRSFNRRMPEEINRVLTDHVSRWLFTPTEQANRNLAAEGITSGVRRVGDVMYDTCRLFREQVGDMTDQVLGRYGVRSRQFFFATVHRAENTDEPARFEAITAALGLVAREMGPVIWAVHPRCRKLVETQLPRLAGVTLTDPLPYFETQALLMHARAALTDSGGLQKEAAFQRTPCITMRDETEWVELVELGCNVLVGAQKDRILAAAQSARFPDAGLPPALYGAGHAADELVEILAKDLNHG